MINSERIVTAVIWSAEKCTRLKNTESCEIDFLLSNKFFNHFWTTSQSGHFVTGLLVAAVIRSADKSTRLKPESSETHHICKILWNSLKFNFFEHKMIQKDTRIFFNRVHFCAFTFDSGTEIHGFVSPKMSFKEKWILYNFWATFWVVRNL